MRRMPFSAAAVFACALAMAGCATQNTANKATALTGPAAAAGATDQTDAESAAGPYAAIAKNLPHNLDGEIRRAQLLRAAGNLSGAVRALAQLMLVAPDDPRIVGEYGKVLLQQGRTTPALAFLTRAIELQPHNWTLYSALGVAYDQNDQRAKAAIAYNHALKLRPGEPTVLNNYAMSEMLAGHLTRAQSLLREASAGGKKYPKIAANLAMIDTKLGTKPGAAAPVTAIASTTPKARPATPAAAVRHIAVAHPAAVHHVAAAHGTKPAHHAVAPHVAAAHSAKAKHHAVEPYSRMARKATPKVIMAPVPYDPLAGKVYPTHLAAKAPHKAPNKAKTHLAKATEKTKQEAEAHHGRREIAKKSGPPALRTASDIY